MSIEDRIKSANEFFILKGLPPDEILRRGKERGLHPAIIERAMVVVAEGYRGDGTDRDRDLVWSVWKESHAIKSKLYNLGRNHVNKQDNRILFLERRIYWLGMYAIFSTIAFIVSRWFL